MTGTLETIAERAGARSSRAPVDHGRGRGRRARRRARLAAAAPARRAHASPSRARARRPARSPRELRELGARVVAGARRSASNSCPGPPLDPTPYDLICLTSPNGVEALFARLAPAGATRARWPAHAWPRSGPAPRARSPSTASRPTCVPERFRRRGARGGARGDPRHPRARRARARRRATCCPDALRARGAEVDVLALYETRRRAAVRSARSRRRGAPTTSRSRPPRRCASSSQAAGGDAGLSPQHADRLDRPGDERDAARARARAPRRGGAPRHRRALRALLADASARAGLSGAGDGG